MKRASGIGLEWKLVIALLVSVTIPLGVSYVLIDQVKESAVNVASNEAAQSLVALEKSLDAYRELFETTKRLHAEIADRLSHRPQLVALDPKVDLDQILADESATQGTLRGIAMLRDDGSVVREASRPLDESAHLRDVVIDQPLPNGGSLRLTFTGLTERVRRAAGAFASAGIEKGDRVAIWAPNSAQWIIAVSSETPTPKTHEMQ